MWSRPVIYRGTFWLNYMHHFKRRQMCASENITYEHKNTNKEKFRIRNTIYFIKSSQLGTVLLTTKYQLTAAVAYL